MFKYNYYHVNVQIKNNVLGKLKNSKKKRSMQKISVAESTGFSLWNTSSLLFTSFSQYRITLYSNQSSLNKCIYFYSTLGNLKCQIKLKLSATKWNAKLSLFFCRENKILKISIILFFAYSFSITFLSPLLKQIPFSLLL